MPQTAQDQQRLQTGIKLQREVPVADLSIRQIDEEQRTVELSFSSEAPVKRWWWTEILCHDEGCVDMSRLSEIGVSLFNHNPYYVLGRVISCEIDAEAHKGRAVVQFDDDEEAEKIYRKVVSGTLKGVSVGYRVDVWEEVEANAKSTNGRFTGPCDVATRWTPYEISIVSVPADATVGVGRSAEAQEPGPHKSGESTVEAAADTGERAGDTAQNKSSVETREVDMDPEEGAVATAEEQRQQAVEAERRRAADITALCRDFDMDPAEFISRGDSLDQVRAAILDKMKERNQPVAAGGPRVEVVEEATDKFRAAAPHALILRSGLDLKAAGIEKPHEAARDLRGMSLRSMAEEYLRLQGRNDAARLSTEDLMRAVFTPDSQFASILDNTVGHAMLVGHTLAETTFQFWTRRGSNKDFKATPKFRLSEGAEPTIVAQNGELEFDEMSDEGVNTLVQTYGKRWGFTRQAMINDDLGVLTTVPMQYAMAARRLVNTTVYAVLNANPAIYDGFLLFDAVNHANAANPGAAPSVLTLDAGRVAMKSQTGLRNLQPLNITPRFIITGVGVETTTQQLLASLADPAAAHSGVKNPFAGSLAQVSDAAITDPAAWHLAADPNAADTIEVTYLNGQDTPTIETRMGWEILGVEWRLWLDFGVTVLDYRGLYKGD